MYRVTHSVLRNGYSVSQIADGASSLLDSGAGRYREDVGAAVYAVSLVWSVPLANISAFATELLRGLPVIVPLRTATHTSVDHVCWVDTSSVVSTVIDHRLGTVAATMTALSTSDYPFDLEE